jgi:hypothetical protein
VRLAVDLSTSTGWAREDRTSGTAVLGGRGAPNGVKYAAWMRLLSDMIGSDGITEVVAETPMPGKRKEKGHLSSRWLVGLMAVTEATCAMHGIPCREATVMEVRSVLGIRPSRMEDAEARRADLKARVMAWCRARGWTPRTDDEGDAIALLEAFDRIEERRRARPKRSRKAPRKAEPEAAARAGALGREGRPAAAARAAKDPHRGPVVPVDGRPSPAGG